MSSSKNTETETKQNNRKKYIRSVIILCGTMAFIVVAVSIWEVLVLNGLINFEQAHGGALLIMAFAIICIICSYKEVNS